MIMINLKENHILVTVRTFQRVVSKRKNDVVSPFGKTTNKTMSGFVYCFDKCFIFFTVAGIKTIITCHFKIPFRYMLNEKFNKVNGRNGLAYKNVIFMSVVVEGDVFPIVGINASQSNDRTSKISADIFEDSSGITKIGFGINIEAIFVFLINTSFCFLKRRTDAFFHFI